MATIAENLLKIKNSVTAIKQSIISKGGNISGDISTWANAINNIPSGGDGSIPTPTAPVFKSDVNFYDYDGTLLHSYTKEQFLALSALPGWPTREGLICQGWNYTLSDAKTYVDNYGMLNIGAMYITDNGDTRLYIRIATEGRMTVPLYWSQTVSAGVSINWGDGSDIQSVSGTGNKNTTHTYAKPGDYVIRLKVVNNCTLGLGGGSSSYCVMGATGNNGKVYCNMLQKVEIGTSVTSIGDYAFYYCTSLASVTIPSSVTSIGNSAFQYCHGMAIYDFTKHTSVPTLANTNAFSSIPSDCVIKVPTSLVDAWKSATNWSTYASNIIGV